MVRTQMETLVVRESRSVLLKYRPGRPAGEAWSG